MSKKRKPGLPSLTDAEVWEILLDHHNNNINNASYYSMKYGISNLVVSDLLFKKRTYKHIRRQFEHYINTGGLSAKEDVTPKYRVTVEDVPIHNAAYYYYDKNHNVVSLSFGDLQFIININDKTLTFTTNQHIAGEKIKYYDLIELLIKHEMI